MIKIGSLEYFEYISSTVGISSIKHVEDIFSVIKKGSSEHFDYITSISTLLNKSLRTNKEGFSGALMLDFVNHFQYYSIKNNMINDIALNNYFIVMTQAYEKKDVHFVADILQYEFMPYLKMLKSTNLNNK